MYQSILLLLLSIDISSIICLIFFAVKRNSNDYKPKHYSLQYLSFSITKVKTHIAVSAGSTDLSHLSPVWHIVGGLSI
jgi:hypothetical protein